MSFFISDKQLQDYFSQISFIFKHITHIREHLDVIFVFGRNTEPQAIASGRTAFLEFTKNQIETPFKFITIETLYTDLRKNAFKSKGVQSEKIHLAELESIAIKNAFSILIFPESPGSFAELGFFSADKETRKKIVVSNNVSYHSEQSYVNSLIELIHEKRQIKPLLFIENDSEKFFSKYINSLIENYDDYENEVYVELKSMTTENMYPLSIIYEMIKLFPYLIYGELSYLIKYTFDYLNLELPNFDDYLKAMISLLVISNLIERTTKNGKQVFSVIDESFSCLKFKLDENNYMDILAHQSNIKKRKN
jgi:hypothetical protein